VGPTIANENHLARYCKPSSFDEGELTVAAFLLRREISETYLSVNWLELLTGKDQPARLMTLRAEIAKAAYKISKNGRYAILNVGSTRELIHERTPDQRWVRVTQETEDFPYYHAGIHDTATDEMLAAQAIVDSVVSLEPAI
jgi:hypothetical protein